MLEKQQVELTGKVSQKVYQTDFQGKVVCLVYLTEISCGEVLQAQGVPIPEGVRVYVDREPTWGSTVVVKGKLRSYREPTNPGEFDARLYYRTLGLEFDLTQAVILRESVSYDRLRENLWWLRIYLVRQLQRYLREEDASVVSTMLLGEKSTLDAQTRDLFKRNGVIHILTVSGVKTLKLDIPLVPETRINWTFVPLHIAIIYILKLCLDEEIIPRCRFPCSRGYHKKYINWQKKQSFSVSQSYRKS